MGNFSQENKTWICTVPSGMGHKLFDDQLNGDSNRNKPWDATFYLVNLHIMYREISREVERCVAFPTLESLPLGGGLVLFYCPLFILLVIFVFVCLHGFKGVLVHMCTFVNLQPISLLVTVHAESVSCPKFVLILHSNWHPHGPADTWIHGSSMWLYVSATIMVLLYNAARPYRQVKGSMDHRESSGDGTPACVMHFVVLYCCRVFGYAVFLLCNNDATGNDDCRQKERGIFQGNWGEMLKIVKTKIQIQSNNNIKSILGLFEAGGRCSFSAYQERGYHEFLQVCSH